MVKTCFLFPGQGSQKAGMGSDFISRLDLLNKFEELNSAIPGLSEILKDGENINEVLNTPKAIYSVSLLAAEALKNNGITPDYVAGFSLGEITALGFCGVLNKDDAAELLLVRTKAMAKASLENPGSMAAVMGMDDEKLDEILSNFKNVYAVNFNSPGQTVISGDSDEMKKAVAMIKEAKSKVIPLRVTGAFHSPFMIKAKGILEDFLKDKKVFKPEIELISNVTARPYGENSKEIKKSIAEQVVSPVQFIETINHLYEKGVRNFIECGEGKVLAGLVSKILKDKSDIKILNVFDDESLENTLNVLKGVGYVQG